MKGTIRLFMLISVVLSALVLSMSVSAQEDMRDAMQETVERVAQEVIAQGNLDVIDEVYAEDFIDSTDGANRDQLKQQLELLNAAITNRTTSTGPIVIEGDTAAFLFTLDGTFENPLIAPDGSGAIPPTGAPIHYEEHVWLRFNENGQIVEQWTFNDNLSLFQQLGLIPAPDMADDAMMATEEAMMETTVEEPMATGMEDANKETVLAHMQSLHELTYDPAADWLAPGFTHTNPLGTYDSAALALVVQGLEFAFPDWNLVVEDQVAEGEWVMTRYYFTGTFTGTFVLADGTQIPGNGAAFEIPASLLTRFDEEGRIVAEWDMFDGMNYLTLVGLLDAGGGEATGEPMATEES